jgi:2-hydroxychromene-2-carboxylate isomerase
MFLSMLEPIQQEAFLLLAREFLAVDDDISAREQDAYDRMAREMGFEKFPPRYIFSHDAAVGTLTTRKSKVVVLVELLNTAYVDGEDVVEKEYIQGLAEEIGIPGATLSKIEDWVSRHVALMNEAVELWLEES